MNDKIHQMITELERFYGIPVQISVERPKENYWLYIDRGVEDGIIHPVLQQTFGMLEKRPCEVVPLPIDDAEIQHDQELIQGKYDHSINQVNEKINSIDLVYYFVSPIIQNMLDENLLKHLGKKYPLGEMEFYHGHSDCRWPSVDGVLADLEEWKKERPDLYSEAIDYLKGKNTTFLYHKLTATLSGVYISKYDFDGDDGCLNMSLNRDKKLLIKKIADVEIQFFDA